MGILSSGLDLSGILGTPSNLGGNLTPEDIAQIKRQGLMQFGSALLQASAPSRMPQNLGSALGTGLQAGMQGQQQAQQSALQNLLLQRQLAKPQQPLMKVGPDESVIDPNQPPGSPPIYSGAGKKTTPYTELAKLESDHNAGIVNDADYAKSKLQILADKGESAPSIVKEYEYARGQGFKGTLLEFKQQSSPNVASANSFGGEALDLAAEKYRVTSQLPQGMSRSPAASMKIMTRAAELAKANGDDAGATILGQQANKAAQTALGNLTKQQTMVGAFEKTANKNLDLAMELSKQVDRTGSPIINKAIIHFKQNYTGDPNTSAFVNALTAARTEYAKVLSGATGSQGVTDAARREADQLFSAASTPQQLEKAIQTAKQEMANRMSSFEDQKKDLLPALTSKKDTVIPSPITKAPQAALDHLKAHPELAEQFKAKYGYVP